MNLPNAHLAIVDEHKVHAYLLSPVHPIGRFKAAFFASLGYRGDQWQQLRDDILSIARAGPARPGQPSPFGQKFEVDGILQRPNGKTSAVTTVWIVLANEDVPRLITAIPN